MRGRLHPRKVGDRFAVIGVAEFNGITSRVFYFEEWGRGGGGGGGLHLVSGNAEAAAKRSAQAQSSAVRTLHFRS
jgi:hypothetical protein